MQYEHVDIGQAAQRRDGGRAGIARGRRHDGGLAAALFQGAGEKAAQYLERHILEGESGAVKQFQQIGIIPQFAQGRDGLVLEAGIGGFDVGLELGGAEGVTGKAAEDFKGHMLVGLAGESGDLLGREMRPGGGHIKAAIRRQAGQQHLGEIGARRLSERGNEMRRVRHGRFR